MRGLAALLLAILCTAPMTALAEPIGPPDLTMRALALLPGAPREGDPVTFNATLVNLGPGTAAGVRVALRVDGDVLETVGPLVLLPGDAVNVSNAVAWTATPGAHTFEAVGDPEGEVAEVREDNNAAALAFSVLALPDLRIAALTLEPAQPRDGDEVHLTARVVNDGAGDAGRFAVRLLLDNQQLLEQNLSGLAAGAAQDVVAAWTASQGTHTATAVADVRGAVDETDEANNARSRTFEVAPPPPVPVPLPDLIVADVAWSPASPEHGDDVTVRALVRNVGDAAAPATATRFTIDGDALGDVATPALAAGADAWIDAPAWTSTAGDHTARAIADASQAATEESEANNERSETVHVAPLPGLPDLVVERLTASPANPQAGDEVALTARVRNGGGTAAGPFEVRFAVDGDTLGTVAVQGLASGASVDVHAPRWLARAGSHALRAEADSAQQVAESDEANNAAARTLEVTEALPDLVVVALRIEPASPSPGERAAFEAVVRNDGAAPTGSVAVSFRVDGQLLGTATLAGLAPGEQRSAWSPPWEARQGARLARAEADPDGAVREAREDNNARTLTLPSLSQLPNLVVETLRLDPAQPAEGATAALIAIVVNTGSASARATDVAFTVDGTHTDARALAALAPGERAEVRSGAIVTPAGEHHYAARADALGQVVELSEEDNERALAYAPGASLAPSSTALSASAPRLAPAAPRAGDAVEVSVSVRNDGATPAEGVEARLLVDGAEVARVPLAPLEASASATARLAWTASEGAHTLEVQLLQGGAMVASSAPATVDVHGSAGILDSWLVVAIVLLAIVVLAAAVRRRRAKRPAR
ncbi:MAG TPA: CARDB domain-containing protein [Candidatus Thermoplasmatota archaeon]|jgi:subtilase family serine protease|nr:CARDB domain-containing protein [Candidatus Thermoplasmatota archaeon]